MEINRHLSTFSADFLYHIGYNREEAKERFGDVKYVITGGSSGRMKKFADLIGKTIGKDVEDLTRGDRFVFFKIGPVISINHGMGVPSITILLHEIIKLLHYAGAVDPVIIRLGTCGGIGVEAGTVVVTNRALNAFLKEEHQIVSIHYQQLVID
jgi:uridine phosphorylase